MQQFGMTVTTDNKEHTALFPTARKVAERNRVNTAMKWKKYRDEILVGQLKMNPNDAALMKSEQEKFMAQKVTDRKIARSLGRELSSSSVFNDFIVDTWRDSKGRRQFNIRGSENPNVTEAPAVTIDEMIAAMTPEAKEALRKMLNGDDKKPAAPINVDAKVEPAKK